VESLAPVDRERFARIYRVTSADAHLRVPQAMAPWVEKTFGSVPSVETQRIVRVSNRVTGESTLFNELRAKRPVRAALRTDATFEDELADDAWEQPEQATPEDPFGRLRIAHGITAANVAKYDAVHSIIVFTEPNPLEFTQDSITAQLDLARQWLQAAHDDDPDASYPYVMWNCLWRAGGSIVHGHMQASMARSQHYGKIERMRHDAQAYQAEHGASYFDDLLSVHRALGLAVEVGSVSAIAHLTPLKEKEVLLLGAGLDRQGAQALFHTLRVFRDSLGVRSFNVGVLMSPLAPSEESWADFTPHMRIVDRGNLGSRTSDIGGMEMFAESVVASDPFMLHEALIEGNP